MPPDFIVVKASSEGDPEGSMLHNVLGAHLALERARQSRERRVHLMAALGLPLWLGSLWPEWLSSESRRLWLVAWAISAFSVAVAVAREWRWRWRRHSEAADIREDLLPRQ